MIEVLLVNRRNIMLAGLGMFGLTTGPAVARNSKKQKRRKKLGSAVDARPG